MTDHVAVIPPRERLAQAVTVGRRLRLARLTAGLTMGQAARLFRVSVPTISDEESDRVTVDGHTLALRADAYGCGWHWLLTGEVPTVELPARAENLHPHDREDLRALLAMCAGWRQP